MGGVVYAEGNGSMGRLGLPLTLAAGDPIPPGTYFSAAGWTAMVDGNPVTMPPGLVMSDGEATSAGGDLFALGAGPPPVWPWPLPWPLNII